MKEKIKKLLFYIIVGVPIFYLLYSGYFYLLYLCFVYIGLLTIIAIGVWLPVSNIFSDYLGIKQKENESSVKKFIRKNQKIIIPIIVAFAVIFIVSLILYFDVKLVPPDLYFRYN